LAESWQLLKERNNVPALQLPADNHLPSYKTTGVDIAKSVLQVHGIDVAGNVVV
jgi:hypothetical protein